MAGEGLGAVRDGIWSQAAVVPRAAVVPLPGGVETRGRRGRGHRRAYRAQCVRELARVVAEDRVLVLGASGGVGSMIVSLGRSAGATVWGQTGNADKVDGIIAHGADRVLVGRARGSWPRRWPNSRRRWCSIHSGVRSWIL